MLHKALVIAGAFTLTALFIDSGHAEVRHERPLRRPYIVEIGDPYSISNATLTAEAGDNSGLREYLDLYGRPNYAEIQEVAPDWPWETYEVRVYYLRRNVEVDFGRVPISAAAADFGTIKFQGGIPASKRLQIEAALQPKDDEPVAASVASMSDPEPVAPPPATSIDAIIARMEAAAERATVAADKAAEQSAAAERAAMRTVSVVEKLSETEAHQRRH